MATAEQPPATHDPTLAEKIRESRKTHEPVEATLKTSERILARITDGIYRQPASALRELISNAYDADATEVTILTDAPRFSTMSIRDNGAGFSPELLERFVENIGDSAKRTTEGSDLNVNSKADLGRSPGGRQLIGKMGIGLFSVAQFTRHFLIITKTQDDRFRSIADITLGEIDSAGKPTGGDIQTGHAKFWQEPASDVESHGTEIKLLDLLPRTRAELSSQDHWMRLDFERQEDGKASTSEPTLHIGRIDPKQPEQLLLQPRLPWNEGDKPKKRFQKFVGAVRMLAETDTDLVDLTVVCDRYLQTIWTLALASPLNYLEDHPFDLTADSDILFFQLQNQTRAQASELKMKEGDTPRHLLQLGTPWLSKSDKFVVSIDGVQLFRPLLFRNQPKTKNAIKNSLLFVGKCREEFGKKPKELSGGPLAFEAYLFWTPKVVPTQHQGVVIRVGNASGPPFDSTFMGYQISEQNRLRQITAEIFVREGLDGSINIDRESFNFAHPHYQFLVKWLHSAIRQLTNKNKELGKKLRTARKVKAGETAQANLAATVEELLHSRGVEDIVEVSLVDSNEGFSAPDLRDQGIVVLRKDVVVPDSAAGRRTQAGRERESLAERKIVAVTQILHSWGVFETLTFSDQEKLISEIAKVIMFEV